MKIKEIRLRTISFLKENHLFYNDNLPLLDRPFFRKTEDISKRIILLSCFKSIVENPEDKNEIQGWINRNGLVRDLSNREFQIINKNIISQQDLIDISWYQESLYAMLWSVNIVKDMNFPSDESNVTKYLQFLPPDVEISTFKKSLNLRGKDELLGELDLYYNLHWSAKKGETRLIKSIVLERRKALEWIVDNNITDWDNIDLST